MPSIRDLRDARRRQSFTGRKPELNTFRQLLLAEEPEYALLHICGVGGVGKSSLLGQYRRIAQELGFPAAQVDLQVNFGVVEILRSLRSQLEGRYFGDFDKALATYNQVQGRLQKTAAALSDGIVSGLREGIPLGLGAAAIDTIGEERIKNWLYQHLPASNADLYLHADRVLTAHFVAGLNLLVERTGRAVIFFDTYELASKAQDAWLREIFLNSDLSSGVLIAIAGRDRLAGMWREWSTVLLSLELAPFTDAEAREYLRQRGITAPSVIEELLAHTGRFPWSLAMFADTPVVQDLDGGALAAGATIHNVADTLIDRFLSQVCDDAELRELVYLCAVPRNFDADVVRSLWERQDVATSLDRMRRFSFVRVRDDGRWSIHSVVRQAMNQRLKNQTPQRWEELNRHAAAFYQQRAAEWPLYSDEWRWLMLESLYHQIQLRESKGIELLANLFEAAKRFCHYDFCSELLSTLDEVQLKRTESLRWAEYYDGKMSRLADNSAWEHAHAVNQALYALPDLEPALRARVAIDLGRYYYHFSCQYQESVAALEESLALRRQLDGDPGEAYVLSHLAPAYAAAGMVADGRLAARRCVALSQELDDRYREGWGHCSLAEAEAQAGNWEAALLHLERSAATFQSLDSEFELGVVLRRVGQAQLRLRQWNRALANFETNLALMLKYDKRAWALRALVDICALHMAKGNASAIRPVAQEASALLEQNPNPAQRARLCTIQAEAALETDDGPAAALFYIDALMALSRTTGCMNEDVAGRFLDRLDELATGGERELARTVAHRVQGDIEAVLNGRLTRGGTLVELDEQAVARLQALGLVEQLANRYQ